MQRSLSDALETAERLLVQFRQSPESLPAMEAISQCLIQAFSTGHKLLTCGNGGSMADAMHVAEEFSGRFRMDRRPYPAIALSDPAHLTCVSNDYGFEKVFSRQVEALGQSGDVLLILSTSGNSKNLVAAAKAAKPNGVTVVSALGKGGGELLALSDLVLMAPGEGSDRIQEIHMLAFHAIIEAVENELK